MGSALLTPDNAPLTMDPGGLDHGPWTTNHGALVPGSWPKSKRLPRGALKPNEHKGPVLQTPDIDAIQIPWTVNHGAIPWVLVALDPGTWCPGSWIMGQYPGFWLRLDPGAQDQGSGCPGAWFMVPWCLDHAPQHIVFNQLPPTTTYCVLVYSQE